MQLKNNPIAIIDNGVTLRKEIIMNINFYLGKLGYEQGIYRMNANEAEGHPIPHRKDLVALPVDVNGDKLAEGDSTVFVVQQTLVDYTFDKNELAVFLKPYDWEE